jgi:membrane associated rhomboid family serine protease
VEVVVLALCTKVPEAVGMLVTSDTTTTVVDVLSTVSLESEAVGIFVVGMMVEVFASVDVVEGTIDVGPESEQPYVELKPMFPTAKLQMVVLVGGAAGVLSAISGLLVFVAPSARVELLIRAGGPWTLAGDVVPISALSSGSEHNIVTVTVTVVLLGYVGMTLV